MRKYGIDSNRFVAISTGNVKEAQAWVVLADGSRRPDPNNRQEVDEQGRKLWRVEAILPADPTDDRDKTETVEITVAGDQPNVGSFGDRLHLDGLWMIPGYVNRRTGQLTAPRFMADGARPVGGAAPRPNKDAA